VKKQHCHHRGSIINGFGAAGAGDFVADIGGNLGVGKAREIVVEGDTLAEGFMDGLAQGNVEVGLAAEDEGEVMASRSRA